MQCHTHITPVVPSCTKPGTENQDIHIHTQIHTYIHTQTGQAFNIDGRKSEQRKYHSYITGYREQYLYCATADVMKDLQTFALKLPTDKTEEDAMLQLGDSKKAHIYR